MNITTALGFIMVIIMFIIIINIGVGYLIEKYFHINENFTFMVLILIEVIASLFIAGQYLN